MSSGDSTPSGLDPDPQQSGISGHHGGGGSWPSKTNPSAPRSGPETPADGPALDRRTWWKKKNRRVDQFVDECPDRAARPISVRDGVKLREEVTGERHKGGYRSRSWSETVREFVGWYNGYRFAHLRFRDPDGDLVRAPMQNSHQPTYGNRYYARLKALERQFIATAENPTVVMLTFTASTSNERGGWRCPADHLRDIVEPWSDSVRPALHRALGSNGADVDEWEYARVLEHHKSGYGHAHVALFIDGDVSESDFHNVMDTHVRECGPASTAAHDYHDPDPENRPISVNDVDLDLDPDPNRDDTDPLGNVASYLAEYIGAHGADLLDRDTPELAFRAACWATGTQRVTFSPGANDCINAELDRSDDDGGLDPAPSDWAPGTTAEQLEEASNDPDRSVSEYLDDGDQRGWSLESIGTVDADGEDVHALKNSTVTYVAIDGAESLDPPPDHGFQRPQRRTKQATL